MAKLLPFIACVMTYDLLKALHTLEDRQRCMTDAEVMTTAIVAALHFHGNFERAGPCPPACILFPAC